jgi:3-oxoisoapionate decarboxylase
LIIESLRQGDGAAGIRSRNGQMAPKLMIMKRRTFVQSSTAGALAAWLPAMPSFISAEETRFGVAEASYMMRWYGKLQSTAYPAFSSAMDMIQHCATLGFGGVQVGIRNWDTAVASDIRKQAESLGMFLEGQIRLPKDPQDTTRFEMDVRGAKLAGIDVIRTACLSGRRYETFETMNTFLDFRKSSVASLRLAEPVMRKHRVKLAVENHKDWRIEEMIEILKTLESEWIGVTLDTGNNISLLEDPMEVVTALAPYAYSVHLKDMGVTEYEDGFLMSEVNLGTGYLNIEQMVRIIKKHRPEIRFNLEMITRDPLKIPCLTEKYWATFDQIPARELAVYLHDIRRQKSTEPLPVVSGLPTDEQLAAEVENNKVSLNFAKGNLGFR